MDKVLKSKENKERQFDYARHIEPMLKIINGILPQDYVSSLSELKDGRKFAQLIDIYEQSYNFSNEFSSRIIFDRSEKWLRESIHNWIVRYYNITYDHENTDESVIALAALLILRILYRMRAGLPQNVKIFLGLGWIWFKEFEEWLESKTNFPVLIDIMQNKLELATSELANLQAKFSENQKFLNASILNQAKQQSNNNSKITFNSTFNSEESLDNSSSFISANDHAEIEESAKKKVGRPSFDKNDQTIRSPTQSTAEKIKRKYKKKEERFYCPYKPCKEFFATERSLAIHRSHHTRRQKEREMERELEELERLKKTQKGKAFSYKMTK